VARVTTLQTNFTSGEMSPRLRGRVDIAKYNNGLETMENAQSVVHGGARRRYGTRYIATAKDAARVARLVPFVFSRTQAFVLELAHQFIRFYADSAQIQYSSPLTPYQIASPYSESELPDVHFAQAADTMFLAHPSYAMRRLLRYANTNWKLTNFALSVPPSEEMGDRPATTLTLGAVTGSGITFTAGADSFRDADVGRYIEAGAGRGLITAYSSVTAVTVTIVDDFASTSIASGAWTIKESPKTGITPSVAEPIGAQSQLTADVAAFKSNAQVLHTGKFIEVNGGLIELTGYTSTTICNGIIRTPLTGLSHSPSDTWAIRENAWNAVDGYPRAVNLYEQRLIAASTAAFPQTIWGSKLAEYNNFADGAADDDGFAFTIAADQVNSVEHLAQIRELVPLTYGGEFSMSGGVEKPLTPTNVRVRAQTFYGTSNTRPERVGNEIVFMQRGGRKVRSIGYRVDIDAYSSPDLSVLAEHITEGGISEMAYQQEPDATVWMVRDDGVLVSMAIDRDQDVVAFARHITDGIVESVAAIPNGSVDQVWLSVQREIDGSTVRYIEVMDPDLNTDCAVTGSVGSVAALSAVWSNNRIDVQKTAHGFSNGDVIKLEDFEPAAFNITRTVTVIDANYFSMTLMDDPGLVETLGVIRKGTVSWSGASHLEGKTVQVVQDGYYGGEYVVASGAVTLNYPGFDVEIGLPYTTTIKDLPFEIPTQSGTAQGQQISVHEVTVRLLNSAGAKINGQQIPTRNFNAQAVLNQPIELYTGDKRAESLGWQRNDDGLVTITQELPLPLHVLAIIKSVSVN
jgi:hypothetical protein